MIVCKVCNYSKSLFYIVLLAALFPFFLVGITIMQAQTFKSYYDWREKYVGVFLWFCFCLFGLFGLCVGGVCLVWGAFCFVCFYELMIAHYVYVLTCTFKPTR